MEEIAEISFLKTNNNTVKARTHSVIITAKNCRHNGSKDVSIKTNKTVLPGRTKLLEDNFPINPDMDQHLFINSNVLGEFDPVTGESKIQNLIDEIKSKSKLILFIDEIHTLMGNKDESLDFANMFKPALDRGDIKVIGATTSEEYERFILRDKAFVRRFQKIIVDEPTRNENIQILMGTLPNIEKRTGAKLKYTDYKRRQLMEFLTDISSEYKRVYEIGSRYPDVTLTLVQQAFSNALFDNRTEVNVFDFRKAIQNTKNLYEDVINKALPEFDRIFQDEEEALGNQNRVFERLDEE